MAKAKAKKKLANKAAAKKAAPKKKKAAARKAAPKKAAAKKAAPKKAAPKKKAAAKKAAPNKKSATALRGVELVEQVIALIEADGGVLGGCGIPNHKANGLPADQIAALALPDGKPLPPSLARFLAYDASYLGVLEGNPPQLAFKSLQEMVAKEFDEQTGEIFAGFDALLPGKCLVLPEGADSRRFMYVGEADEHGEYPVFVVDTDDVPFVCLAYPGLDVYLADGSVVKIIEGTYTDGFEHAAYAPMMEEQARRNFSGFKSFDFGGGDTEHLDGEGAIDEMMATLAGAEN